MTNTTNTNLDWVRDHAGQYSHRWLGAMPLLQVRRVRNKWGSYWNLYQRAKIGGKYRMALRGQYATMAEAREAAAAIII